MRKALSNWEEVSNLDPDDTQNSNNAPGMGGMTGGSTVAEEPLKTGPGSVPGSSPSVSVDEPVVPTTSVPESSVSAPPAPPAAEETAVPGVGAATSSVDAGVVGGSGDTGSTPMGSMGGDEEPSVGSSPVGSSNVPGEEDEGDASGSLGK